MGVRLGPSADRCLRAVWFRPHAIVRWMSSAKPRDFAELAPIVVQHAVLNDPVGAS